MIEILLLVRTFRLSEACCDPRVYLFIFSMRAKLGKAVGKVFRWSSISACIIGCSRQEFSSPGTEIARKTL
jgi:hypothetical protein